MGTDVRGRAAGSAAPARSSRANLRGQAAERGGTFALGGLDKPAVERGERHRGLRRAFTDAVSRRNGRGKLYGVRLFSSPAYDCKWIICV